MASRREKYLTSGEIPAPFNGVFSKKQILFQSHGYFPRLIFLDCVICIPSCEYRDKIKGVCSGCGCTTFCRRPAFSTGPVDSSRFPIQPCSLASRSQPRCCWKPPLCLSLGCFAVGFVGFLFVWDFLKWNSCNEANVFVREVAQNRSCIWFAMQKDWKLQAPCHDFDANFEESSAFI